MRKLVLSKRVLSSLPQLGSPALPAPPDSGSFLYTKTLKPSPVCSGLDSGPNFAPVITQKMFKILELSCRLRIWKPLTSLRHYTNPTITTTTTNFSVNGAAPSWLYPIQSRYWTDFIITEALIPMNLDLSLCLLFLMKTYRPSCWHKQAE